LVYIMMNDSLEQKVAQCLRLGGNKHRDHLLMLNGKHHRGQDKQYILDVMKKCFATDPSSQAYIERAEKRVQVLKEKRLKLQAKQLAGLSENEILLGLGPRTGGSVAYSDDGVIRGVQRSATGGSLRDTAQFPFCNDKSCHETADDIEKLEKLHSAIIELKRNIATKENSNNSEAIIKENNSSDDSDDASGDGSDEAADDDENDL